MAMATRAPDTAQRLRLLNYAATLQRTDNRCVIWKILPLSIPGARMTRKNATGSASTSSRRSFLSAAGAAALSFTIVPRHVLGGPGHTPPSERVNVAGIGAGGMGGGDIATVAKLGDPK